MQTKSLYRKQPRVEFASEAFPSPMGNDKPRVHVGRPTCRTDCRHIRIFVIGCVDRIDDRGPHRFEQRFGIPVMFFEETLRQSIDTRQPAFTSGFAKFSFAEVHLLSADHDRAVKINTSGTRVIQNANDATIQTHSELLLRRKILSIDEGRTLLVLWRMLGNGIVQAQCRSRMSPASWGADRTLKGRFPA